MDFLMKYFDCRKATVDALLDFPVMTWILENTDDDIKELHEIMEAPTSHVCDGIPGNKNLQAYEEKMTALMDKINIRERRYASAKEYMDWFLPVWECLDETDRFVLSEFYFDNDDAKSDAINRICETYNIERSSAYKKKNRALNRLQRALFGSSKLKG